MTYVRGIAIGLLLLGLWLAAMIAVAGAVIFYWITVPALVVATFIVAGIKIAQDREHRA